MRLRESEEQVRVGLEGAALLSSALPMGLILEEEVRVRDNTYNPRVEGLDGAGARSHGGNRRTGRCGSGLGSAVSAESH